MFRKTLLATTALVLGATVAFAAHTHQLGAGQTKRQFGTPGHVVHGIAVNFSIGNKNHAVVRNNTSHWTPGGAYSNFSKDKNAEFVSWYGFRAEDSGFSSNYGSGEFFRDSEVANNAVGFNSGASKAAGMTIAGFGYASTDKFEGVILSSVGGLPGNAIAHTVSTSLADTGLCCSTATTLKFVGGKAKLTSGTQYFASLQCANSPCNGGWAMEDTDFTGATVDYFHYSYSETYNFGSGTHTYAGSSPWHASTYYPTAGAVIVK